ncbi:MAG: tetratricopeptide repeat protein [Ferruginibacter sp.]
MTDVFISYARSSAKEQATTLKDGLIEKGVKVFLDEVEIPAGGTFPTYLADALTDTKLVIVFADETYFSKTWCVYEFKVCIAPCQQAVSLADKCCEHIIIALPEKGGVGNIMDHLPVALKTGSWLKYSDTTGLVKQVMQQLSKVQETLGKKLEGLDNDAVKSLRNGALINAASKLPQKGKYLKYLPESLKEKFVGRADKLWEIFAALETKAAQELSRSVLIEGGAGMGKTQLAAEYVWRYGPGHYPGGIVWINADCTDNELQQQFAEVLKKFNIQMPVADANNESSIFDSYAGLMDDYFSNLPLTQAVLWVVDNVPEPQAGVAIKSVTHWCPVNESVSLICTSRQSNIKIIDTIILLSELTVPSAVELITQPPVKKTWASDNEWEKIVRAVGCWPMGLRIMHASLADSIITPAALIDKLASKNPSPLLDDTVKELQGFVEDGYVKGVSELFQFSYNDLKNFPVALSGAHAIAWLARTPLPEDLLLQLLPGNSLAILGKRHWIDASDKTDDIYAKHWLMHRIMAGFFKSISNQQEQEFKLIIDWFAKIIIPGIDWEKISMLDTHFRVFSNSLLDWLYKHPTSPLLENFQVLVLQLACFQMKNNNARGLRFTAASLAYNLGIEDSLVEKYKQYYLSGDEDMTKGIAYCLRGMKSVNAANLLVKFFSDKSKDVRWQAILATQGNVNTDILAMHWLDALLKESEYFFLDSSAVDFDNIFKTASDNTKAALLNKITQSLQEDESQQSFLISLIGRLLLRYGKQFNAGGYTYDDLNKILVKIVVETQDRETAEKAAGELANAYKTGATFQQLLDALTFEKELAKIPLLFFANIAYVERLAAPKPLKEATATWNDEGGVQIDLQLGDKGMDVVPFYRPLVYRIAGHHNVKTRDDVVKKIGSRQEGLKAIQEEINLLIDEAKWPMVLNLAEGVLNVLPVFKVNGHWWRGQAYSKLNQSEEAINDFTEVIQLAPDFSEARNQRIVLYYAGNNSQGIKNDLEYFVKESPDNYKYLHDLGYTCFNLEEYTQALNYLTQCLKLNDQYASAWYLRSYTNFYLNDLTAAKADIDMALQLEPQNVAYIEMNTFLLKQ